MLHDAPPWLCYCSRPQSARSTNTGCRGTFLGTGGQPADGSMMGRRFLAAAAAAFALGLGAFWLLTSPSSIPASTLPQHAADVANGRTMFFAGGCPSCHAVPKQEDHTLLGGGLGL